MSQKTHDAQQIITGGDMSLASITSQAVNIEEADNVGVQMNWTGTPVGTFAVQCSIDGSNWVALSLPSSPAAAGGASSALLDLVGLCSKFLRVVYTKGSSTGSLDVFVQGKGL